MVVKKLPKKTMGLFVGIALGFSAVLSGCASSDGDGSSGASPSSTEENLSFDTTFSLELGSSLGLSGVSPEIIKHPEGGYLLLATSIDQIRAFRSSNGADFEPDPSISLPMGSDYSLVQRPDNSWLLYYVSFDGPPGNPGEPMDPSTMTKVVMVSTSQDLKTFSAGQATGISQDGPGMAWGVPDTYVTPEGKVMMMWVDEVEGENWEVLRTATSADGLSFTANEGFVISDGYVDPYILRAEEGDWVALLSTTPATQRLPQKIFLARSTNGETWSIAAQPLLEASDRNYLDPGAVEVAPGEWLVILSTSEKDQALSGPYDYVSATLREQE